MIPNRSRVNHIQSGSMIQRYTALTRMIYRPQSFGTYRTSDHCFCIPTQTSIISFYRLLGGMSNAKEKVQKAESSPAASAFPPQAPTRAEATLLVSAHGNITFQSIWIDGLVQMQQAAVAKEDFKAAAALKEDIEKSRQVLERTRIAIKSAEESEREQARQARLDARGGQLCLALKLKRRIKPWSRCLRSPGASASMRRCWSSALPSPLRQSMVRPRLRSASGGCAS